MKKIQLGKTGEKISVLGQGTYGIDPNTFEFNYENWKRALKKGIELGMNHIDTAELYGDGFSEKFVGEIAKEFDRDELFITTKLLPYHRTEKDMINAVNNSLKRLGLKYVDLYLIHWLEPYSSIKQVVQFLEKLVDEGKTRFIGVSNFSLEEFKKAQQELRKYELVTNQIKLNITDQIHLQECLPYYQDNNIVITAYSPLASNGLANIDGYIKDNLEILAQKHNVTIQQLALAWLINHNNVIAIPKAFQIKHVIENAKAAEIKLTTTEIKQFYLQMIDGFY
jgi:diketogulonate reductase-like aldo/keto reductase